jgi:phosphatidylserine decarboxylase precursor
VAHGFWSNRVTETFNQFFYRYVALHFFLLLLLTLTRRKLKPSARPVELPDDPYRLVCGADCRFMAFESVNDATRLWIKGREFTVARLLGDTYKGQYDRYLGGAVAIFRLAPQDYHRFHSPVDGTIGSMTYISGEYYTVNVSCTNQLYFSSFIALFIKLAPSHTDNSRRLR